MTCKSKLSQWGPGYCWLEWLKPGVSPLFKLAIYATEGGFEWIKGTYRITLRHNMTLYSPMKSNRLSRSQPALMTPSPQGATHECYKDDWTALHCTTVAEGHPRISSGVNSLPFYLSLLAIGRGCMQHVAGYGNNLGTVSPSHSCTSAAIIKS